MFRMKKRVFIVAGLCIALLFIILIASNFAVPPPQSPEEFADTAITAAADVPEDAERWEYKAVPLPSGSVNSIEDLFNELGKNGWEYADTISRIVIFKRKLNQ